MSEPVVYEEVSDTSVSPFIGMARHEFVGVVITGLAVGVATAVLYYLLNQFVFGAVLCRAESTGNCAQAPSYAALVAVILGTIGGVANLARIRVYRPLLVALAAVFSLWGLHSVLAGVAWYWALACAAVLFALAYALFAWVARVRNFGLAIIVTVVLVVLARWVLVA